MFSQVPSAEDTVNHGTNVSVVSSVKPNFKLHRTISYMYQYRATEITPNHSLIKLVLWSTNIIEFDIQLSDKLNKVVGLWNSES